MSNFKLLINGRLVDGDDRMAVVNPATEQAICDCPRASEAQFREAVAAAKAAFPGWSATPLDERREVLRRMADAIEANTDELARLLTAEQGKPLADAIGEVGRMAAHFRHFAGMEMPVEVLEDSAERRVETHRQPLGVVAVIVPWNFPLSIMAMKVAPGLVAGNTLVVKPAATTPLSTLRFAEAVAGLLPPGVLNVVTDANDLGAVLTEHPDVRKVSFTGSTATGRKVMASAADTVKRVTLELGGNDAAIVLDDAQPEAVARDVFQFAFKNSGQVCLAIKRLFVHASLYDEVCAELARLAEAAVVDDGMKQGTQYGPLQNRQQYERVRELLADAERNGKVIAGGDRDGPGYFIRPAIVRDIAEGARLVDEEQFGPALPVMRYDDIEEVIRRANATDYGLGASVWSSDPDRAREVAMRLEAGSVWVNRHGELLPHVPFGGAKQSGIGVELGELGLAEFTQLKVVNMHHSG